MKGGSIILCHCTSHDYVILMIKLELIIVNVQHGGPSRPCQNCHSCMFGTKENSNLSICIQYLGNHSKTACQKSAKSTRYRVRPKFKFYRKPLLSLPRQPLAISWIVLESPLFEWRENLFAPKCSYANIPYVKCCETLIISGSCVFLLPLPFELKFSFFEFEYVTWL